MAKGGTSVKEAIAKWHVNNPDTDPKEAKIVKLYMQIPPIEKMDSSLTNLPACEMLSLSSNCIEKITNLNGLKNLKILSLGRNLIKNLTGIEAVSDTLEQLWISYNQIEKLKGITVLSKLQVLYMSNNNVKDWSEFMKIADLHKLKELIFVGNPLEEKHSAEGDWRDQVIRRLPKLSKLDGVPIVRQEEEEEQ